ncbi:outer membrane protein assembly factor BamB family protein [Echinicola shivajiensis]|uniref:outer membrane protein assembly factor BamB family protein n=1 Tax=Echinicola shivajiensis TaxID=1035916 RepID=UPI001BFC7EF9|nr:PQQ-binding-like beta-propeller repeat protein [Echinicola shivajiensis]
MKYYSLFLVLVLGWLSGCEGDKNNFQQYWPQPAGPNGNWQLTTTAPVPTSFSVRTGENIKWTSALPEGGQSGITVWEDRIFLTVMKPVEKVVNKQDLMGSDVLALCLDAENGEMLWSREMEGSSLSEYMYGFSDSSTPSPVTDGEYVWFYNASGNLSCFDFEGNLKWERRWEPVEELDGVHFPFNKQFEPLIYEGLVFNMEPYWGEDGEREYGWNYIYGIDKLTGEVVWISEDGLTHYNTPYMGKTANGLPALMIGRGGHHGVPEQPIGYSLVNLENGKSIWRHQAEKGMALYNATWNQDYAIWYTEKENEVHVLDAKTGILKKKVSLTKNADVRIWDEDKAGYQVLENIDISEELTPVVFPAWYSNILVGDKLFFMCFKKGPYRNNIGPEYALARVDINTGKAAYLQVPVQVEYHDNVKEYVWNEEAKAATINNKGLDVAHDKRSQRDGWHWNFNGNPICVNGKVFFTTMAGVCYVIDANAEKFDESALIAVNDLGPKGGTWSVNTPSFANGKLYHRTLKNLISIGKE